MQQRPIPQDDIVIKVAASGVCGTDLKTYLKGHHMFQPNSVLGHEAYGEIVNVAGQIDGFKPGEHVVVAPYYECGECDLCRKGVGQLCTHKRFIQTGCFSEYIAVSAEYARKGLYKIAEGHDVYTLVEPLACVINGMEKLDLAQGRKVLVVGSGPMGTLFAIALSGLGVPVDVVEISEWRREKLTSYGFNVLRPEEVEQGKYDQIVLTVNRPELVQLYLSLATNGGNLLLFSGFSKSDRAEIDPYDIHYREVRITGSFGYSLAQFRKSLQMIEHNKDSFGQMITHKFGLDDGAMAFDILKNGEAMKLILKL
jgi:L-iditol 2-dehydrogenase